MEWIASGIGWELGRVMPSHIDPELCSGCRTCEPVCPTGSLRFDEERKVMTVNPFSCKGCGNCVSTCPSGVPYQAVLSCRDVLESLEALVAGNGSGHGDREAGPPKAGREDTLVRWLTEDHAEPGLVLEALEQGFDLVVLAPAERPPESGHGKRVASAAGRVLEALGLRAERVGALSDAQDVGGLGDLLARARELGPNPVRLEVRP